jgi:transcriptional regulator of acetoin/glycerol metabolism
MKRHSWPGNVRELENAVRFAAIRAQGRSIHPEHLPQQILSHRNSQTSKPPQSKLDLTRVRQALDETDGNKSQAARDLGVSRATLYRFLNDHPL